MELFVVYKNPSDYPGMFVVRRWSVTKSIRVDVANSRLILSGSDMKPDQEPVVVADTLEMARSYVPDHITRRVNRHPDDDPVILEIWL